jgi:mRNA-degrading endonuclease RelE of RelBE toxin-antitoxin system
MARVSLSPEAVASFRRLPDEVKVAYDQLILGMIDARRLRLPGALPTYKLEGAPNLWTLKVGRFRGILRWDGQEVRFVRFGHRRDVYRRLPK